MSVRNLSTLGGPFRQLRLLIAMPLTAMRHAPKFDFRLLNRSALRASSSESSRYCESHLRCGHEGENVMPAGNLLYYALVALVIALIAGFLGFGGIAGTATGIAQILFYIFLVIFLVVVVMNLMGRNRGPRL
jgi:uncharacterized membrane protein YtjA (UPF0391 family)